MARKGGSIMIYDPLLQSGYYSIDFVKGLGEYRQIYYNFDSDGDIFFKSYHAKEKQYYDL